MATTSHENWRVSLKEYAETNKFTLKYSENGRSGPPHNPTFNFKVTMLCNNDEIEATGSGNRMKVAKEQAARALMQLVMQPDKDPSKSDIPTGECQIQPGEYPPKSDILTRECQTRSIDKDCGKNVISELQELCQKKNWPLPSYNEQKDGYICVYVCRVNITLQNYDGEVVIRMKGAQTSKKLAKISAAEKTLRFAKLLVDITEVLRCRESIGSEWEGEEKP